MDLVDLMDGHGPSIDYLLMMIDYFFRAIQTNQTRRTFQTCRMRQEYVLCMGMQGPLSRLHREPARERYVPGMSKKAIARHHRKPIEKINRHLRYIEKRIGRGIEHDKSTGIQEYRNTGVQKCSLEEAAAMPGPLFSDS